jgi:hypothetical protein
MDGCADFDGFYKESDAELFYHNKQSWTMCNLLYEEDETNFSTMPHLRQTPVGTLLGPLLDAGLLNSIQFSKLDKNTLVEWHADEAYNLVSRVGLNCSQSADEAFANSKMDPWDFDDVDGGLSDVRLHIPLSDQSATHFYASGAALSMKPGEMIVLDFYQPHSLYNAGTEARVNLLVDFTLTKLNDESTMRLLLTSDIGRKIFASILRVGYHDAELIQARIDLEKLLYEYHREQCHGRRTGTLDGEDSFHGLLEECRWSGVGCNKKVKRVQHASLVAQSARRVLWTPAQPR